MLMECEEREQFLLITSSNRLLTLLSCPLVLGETVNEREEQST